MLDDLSFAILQHYGKLAKTVRTLHTVAAPLIAAASNQKIFFGQLGAASIQERPLIKK